MGILTRTVAAAAAGMTMTLLNACQSPHPPIRTEANVDLQRFMGDWYVIANIPSFFERGAHNAVESYRLAPDGTIETTFTFNKGAFDGPRKQYTPRGFVLDTSSNAVWGMQFVWPIKADYRIVYVSDSYDRTIVGRQKRDYVWIMARTPQLAESEYRDLLAIVQREGYDVSAVRRVPQQPKSNTDVAQ
jgi:apolipoprotein D and lipocalin family protein